MKKFTSMHSYLRYYNTLQEDIIVVYRHPETKSWRDRCLYLSDKYSPHKNYNHRSILDNEIVIEFDDNDKNNNLKWANEVTDRLSKDKIKYSKWFSGNKSYHVHFLINTKEATNISLLKNVLMRYYCEGLPLPDLRLSSKNHLIRAEYGVHEKTGKKKSLISKSPGYPAISIIPDIVWEQYTKRMSIVTQTKVTKALSDITELEGFKYILSSHKFRSVGDGHERALFMLIHTLKNKYTNNKEGLIKFLQDWYKYSNGRKLSPQQIRNKVNYHWNRTYTIGKHYLYELLEAIGKNDYKETNNKMDTYT